MRILYGITKSNFGGAQRYVFDLAKGMRSLGHDVSVLCGGNGTLVEKLKKENIRVITLPHLKRDISMLSEFRSLHFIFQTLRKEKPEIFHTNSSKMGGLGNAAARLARINKIIFTAHGWEFNAPRPWWSKILIKIFSWLTVVLSHKTICVSNKTKGDISRLPFIKNKLLVIYNGIESFNLLPRKEGGFVVGTVAELHKVKGIDTLLTAWSKFIKNHTGKLVIIGDGEEKENLMKLKEDLSISESVDFAGYIENASQRLPDFDVFCMPSRSEAMPYSLLEAGFAGKPVIATLVGGIPEIIENGINGALIPKEDPEQLFSSLVLFHDNQRMRDRLGQTLKKTVEDKFSFKKMFDRTLDLYKTLGPRE